jgi:L-fuculose-phosphate aldolase
MSIEQIKEQVCKAGLKLLEEGLVARTWGNVSIKVNEEQMVITPSGRKYEELTPNDMVLVNFHTLAYEGKLKPSSELKLHAQIYKTRPDVTATIHTHQLYGSIVAVSRKDVVVYDEKLQEILGTKIVKSAPYALPNTKKITMETAAALGNTNAALMANHGVVCTGKNLDDVFVVCKALEEACKQFLNQGNKKVA